MGAQGDHEGRPYILPSPSPAICWLIRGLWLPNRLRLAPMGAGGIRSGMTERILLFPVSPCPSRPEVLESFRL